MKPTVPPFLHGLLSVFGVALVTLVGAQGAVDVRLYGAEGTDEATAIWTDGLGTLMAGETTSQITMAQGQAVWAPGGPVGKKGFVVALDEALELEWGFAFAGDPSAPLGVPSVIRVEEVVRTASGQAAVLYHAMVEGQWRAFLRRIDDVALPPMALSIEGAVQQTNLTPAGEGTFLVSGSSVPTFVPTASLTGVFVGLWEGGDSAPVLEVLPNTEGMVTRDATWHQDTLYVAVDHALEEEEGAILIVTVTDGQAAVVGKAPVEANLTLSSVDAGPLGVAWAGTLVSSDGTLDAVFGKLGEPTVANPSQWDMAWEAVTESGVDRMSRQVVWRNDVVRCTAQATNSGAGGTGILVQERSGETGAWFGAFTFGGEGGEDVAALAIDANGRMLMAGSSNSWSEATDAALYRLPLGNLSGSFDYDVSNLAQAGSAFVGLEPVALDCLSALPMSWTAGQVWESPELRRWSICDVNGRRLDQNGSGRLEIPPHFGWAVLVLEADCGTRRSRIFIRP